MKYKCKKSFCVDRYDEDGFLIMMIGGQDHVHIDAVDYGSWLEITKKHFEEYFELLKVE